MSPALHAWTRLVVLLALVKVAAGLVAFFVVAGDHPLLPMAAAGGLANAKAFPYVFYLLFLLSFGGAGIGLVLVGRDDPRALTLAGFLLAVATAYCNYPLREMMKEVGSPLSDVLGWLEALKLQAFMPFFLWSFVQTFPELTLPMRARRLFYVAVQVSLWIGIILVSLNAVGVLMGTALERAKPVQWAFEEIAPKSGGGLFYGLIFPPLAAALAALVWKARRATGEGGRRVQMLAGIMAVGLAPVVLEVLCEFVVPGYTDYLSSPRALLWILIVACVPALLVPCGIAYAVVVHHVLGLRLIARQALRYALARLTVLTFAAAPLIVLGVLLQTVDDLLSGRRLLLLVTISAVGFAALHYRIRLLESLDRRYFREQYDARRLLTGLVQLLRSARGTREIADLLCQDVDRALHLERVALFAADPRTGDLVDPRSRARLDASTPLARLVAGASDPLDVDLDAPHSSVAKLPAADRSWLAGAGFQLLVPLVARDGSLLGFLGLGPKRSGLPFLREDRKLLEAIAGSAALGLELDTQSSQGRPAPGQRSEEEDDRRAAAGTGDGVLPSPDSGNAKECPVCFRLFRSFTVLCTHDSHRLETAPVPYVLPGKLRFEQRIGAGGMGVVYRGIDLGLSRPVAIKTLRRVSPDDALRLRREARTAASVSHPHLAAVYGVENWQGTPMLLMELMEEGTLTQRIEKGPFGERATLDLGLAMAAALEHLHAADILHRDIKPSNIGFTRNGVPKLMDFGIARLMFDLRREQAGSSDDTAQEGTPVLPPTSVWDRSPTSITRSRQLVGTISYLSPEALQGEPADPSFDLWSLCLVLYECLLGRKIFTGADHKQLLARIRNGRVPDFEQALPHADPALGFFFREALHRTVARRPATAGELRRRLAEVRALLGTEKD